MRPLMIALALFSTATPALQVPSGGLASATATIPAFEVASIKSSDPNARGSVISGPTPGQFTVRNMPLRQIVLYAYGVRDDQLVDAPEWAANERFDIVGKYPEGSSPAQATAMLRTLLGDRFKLRIHAEEREGSIYHLVVADANGRLGPKLRKSELDCSALRSSGTLGQVPRGANGAPPCLSLQGGAGDERSIDSGGSTMAQLAVMLAGAAGREVLDRTGIAGDFTFQLRWTPDLAVSAAQPPTGGDAVSLFTALREQLGLRLESQRGRISVQIVDHIERPTPD